MLDYYSKLYEKYMTRVIDLYKKAEKNGELKKCEHLNFLIHRLN